MQIDPKKSYRATIETDRGKIVMELYPEHAPKTVNNFVFLAREGFYDEGSFTASSTTSSTKIRQGDAMPHVEVE